MRRTPLLALFGLAMITLGVPAKAQSPIAGQAYMVPPGYEAYPAGSSISYGGYNYVIQGNGTMTFASSSAPGGFITGNPSPYDPNAVAGGSSSSSGYWDPYRGWVTNTRNTTVLNSALSPGRAPMPGTSIQRYNYWDGTQWVRGERWLGQDGMWHGRNSQTITGPSGSTTNDVLYYAPPRQGSGANANTNTNAPYRSYNRGYSAPNPARPGGFGPSPRFQTR